MYIKNSANGISSKSFFIPGSLAFLAVVIFQDQYFVYILYTSIISCICFTAFHDAFILSFASPSCFRLMTLVTNMLFKDDLEVMIWVELKHRFPPYHTYKSYYMLSRKHTHTLAFPCSVFNCMLFIINAQDFSDVNKFTQILNTQIFARSLTSVIYS